MQCISNIDTSQCEYEYDLILIHILKHSNFLGIDSLKQLIACTITERINSDKLTNVSILNDREYFDMLFLIQFYIDKKHELILFNQLSHWQQYFQEKQKQMHRCANSTILQQLWFFLDLDDKFKT